MWARLQMKLFQKFVCNTSNYNKCNTYVIGVNFSLMREQCYVGLFNYCGLCMMTFFLT